MTLVVIGIIFFMFRKKKGEDTQPVEPQLKTTFVSLASGKTMKVMTKKGQSIVGGTAGGDPSIIGSTTKRACPVGYILNVITHECVPERGIMTR